jgi:type I restriction enzyme S subunit
MNDKKKSLVPALRFGEFVGEWERKKLGELGSFKGGGTPSTSVKKYWSGNIPWISSSDILDGDIHNIKIHRFLTQEGISNSATKIIPKNSILLISRVGVGKLAINKVDLCTSQDFANFIPKICDNYFIGYFLIARKNILINFAQGTSIKGFTTSDIKTLGVNLPKLPEQQKIANFLSSVDKKIEQLRQKVSLLEDYKKGVMQQIFSQQIRFKDDNGEAFADWEAKKLGEVGSFFSGGTPKSTNRSFYIGNIAFIGSGNIHDKEVSNFISEKAFNSSSAKLIEKGDLLVALYGANSGDVAISQMNGAINQAILCIRSKSENIKFLLYLLLLNKEKIISKYLQGGQGNLSASIIKKLKYCFPSINEQQRIANYLSSLDEKIQQTKTQLKQAQAFKKGLLQQLFV